jgi:hypothetical protein
VEAGTLADHRARVTARASMWAAIAWSVAALAGAPLAAWAQGAVTALATRRPGGAARAARGLRDRRRPRRGAARGARRGAHREGQTVDTHYTGTLLDGTIFDASWERGAPFTFPYGAGG